MTDRDFLKLKCLVGAVASAVLLTGCMSVSVNDGVPKQEDELVQSIETHAPDEPEETDEKEDNEVIEEQEIKDENLIPGADFNESNPGYNQTRRFR